MRERETGVDDVADIIFKDVSITDIGSNIILLGGQSSGSMAGDLRLH